MRITLEYDHVEDSVRLIDTRRDAEPPEVDSWVGKHARRSLEAVAGADGYDRSDVVAQAARVWEWLTPRTRRILASSDNWHEPGAERLKLLLDRVAERAERATHRALAEAAARIDGGER